MSSFERQLCCGGIMQTASHASSHFLIGLVPIMLETLYHPTMSDFEWKWNPMNVTSFTFLRLLLPFVEWFSHCSTAEGAEYRWHPCGLFGNSHPAGCSLPCVPCLISKSWRETRLRGVSVCLRVIWATRLWEENTLAQLQCNLQFPSNATIIGVNLWMSQDSPNLLTTCRCILWR